MDDRLTLSPSNPFRPGAALIGALIGGAALYAAQQPTFRGGVHLVPVDVRVVDANGEFVRDLRPEEFRIFESDIEQPLNTFSLVELPLTFSSAASLAGRRVESDVASNAEAVDGRLYVLLMDDRAKLAEDWSASKIENPYQQRSPTFRAIAREFIERNLTDADRMAVVTTSGRRDLASEFTGNRQQLLEAVNRFENGYGQVQFLKESSTGTLHSGMQSITDVMNWLGGIEGRRKTMVVITELLSGIDPDDFEFAEVTGDARDVMDLVASAARANVTMYILDPTGQPGAPAPGIKPIYVDDQIGASTGPRVSLEYLAEATGGFALTGSNLFTAAMERIVVENSSYYLLGYASSDPRQDGKFRRLRIEVTRPGLTAHARVGYWTEKPEGTSRPPPTSGVSPSLTELLKSPLPVSGLSMSVSATTYRGRGSRASVAVVVEARGRDLQFLERDGRLHGSVSLLISIAGAGGRVRLMQRGDLALRLSPGTHTAVTSDGLRLVQRFEVPPGQYQLKVAAADGGGKEKGSVVYDLLVPEFSKGALSMSPIALASNEASGTPTTGPDQDQTWKTQLGMPPTTRREFHAGDELRSYVEIYDNRKNPAHEIEVTSTVQRESGETVLRQVKSLQQPTREFQSTRTMLSNLSVGEFGPGRYVLTLEARSSLDSAKPVSRQVPFSVR